KGLHKELQKGRQPTAFIRRARIIQGRKDLRNISENKRIETARKCAKGWDVILEMRREIDVKRCHGIMGKWKVSKKKENWKKKGVFENVAVAEKTLDARRNGEPIDVV